MKSKDMVNALRGVVACVGEEMLGIRQEDIGTHSIRSGAAMAMNLPRRMPSLCYYDDREMVIGCLFEVHPEAS